MAWLQKRGETYHISFFHGGKHYSRSLKTDNERKANGAKVDLAALRGGQGLLG